MNKELIESLEILEKEKDISKEVLLEAIENSLITAYKNHFGKADNVKVTIDRETGDYGVFAEKVVVEEVEDPLEQVSEAAAREIDPKFHIGDIINVEVKSKEFGRIATMNAKNVILQKIREEERKVLYDRYFSKENDVVTGIVQRVNGKNISVNLGKVDAVLTETEQVFNEHFEPNDRIKLFVSEVRDTARGPRVVVSRANPKLVMRLFEAEVAEIHDGTVEIVNVAREPGVRTKVSVKSNNPRVEPIGACVGMNGTRIQAVIKEINGEKIDVVRWDENPAIYIENAIAPAKVVSVIADDEAKIAKVVVPDYQLSLAIGKEGLNAKLTARLTGFKIDIKSETQNKAIEAAEAEAENTEIDEDYDSNEAVEMEDVDYIDETTEE